MGSLGSQGAIGSMGSLGSLLCVPGLKTPLFQHQVQGVKWMSKLESRIARGRPVGMVDYFVPLEKRGDVALMWDEETHTLLQRQEAPTAQVFARGGVLSDGIGSGKTLQMLALAIKDKFEVLRASNAQGPQGPQAPAALFRSKATLVVCGKQLIQQWSDEIQKHFAPLDLRVVVISNKQQHRNTTYELLCSADFVVTTVSFLRGSYYRDEFLNGHITPDIFPPIEYLSTLYVNNYDSVFPVLEFITFRRLVLDEGDACLLQLPFMDPMLEHKYSRRLTSHCRANCNASTTTSAYLMLLQADFRWVVTNTMDFRNELQNAALSAFLQLSASCGQGASGGRLYAAAPRSWGPRQMVSLDRSLQGPSVTERHLYKRSVLDHLLLQRAKSALFQENTIPPLDVQVIWVEYTQLERQMVSAALEVVRWGTAPERPDRADRERIMTSDRERLMLAFPLIVTQTNQEQKQSTNEMTLSQASDYMLQHQQQLLGRTEARIAALREEVEVFEGSTGRNAVLDTVLASRIRDCNEGLQEASSQKQSIERSIQFLTRSIQDHYSNNCIICLEPVAEGASIITVCGHSFCKVCIEKAMRVKRACPSCRAPLKESDLVLIREQKQDGAAEEKASSEEALLQDYGSRFVALLKYIRQVRAEDPTAQFLVFSEWSLELQKHALLLQKLANITTAEVKGTTSHCQHSIAMFKEKKIDVILLSLHTMAAGLHLVNANHVIFLTPLGEPHERALQIERQAIGRCHRLGQTKRVHVRHIITKNTAEERLYNNRTGNVY